MEYPRNFRRPVPLKIWMESRGMSQAKTGLQFGGFTAGAIQKMLRNPDRDVGVIDIPNEPAILVETEKQEVITAYAENRMLETDIVYTVKKLSVGVKLGPRKP